MIETSILSMEIADRISDLPDSLICHILSFLPTEQAVATSVLSKRWRPLWQAIPTLNFDDDNYSENRDTYLHFLRLVYTVLLLRGSEQQSIKKLSLKCKSSFCYPSDVNTWVIASIQCKVERLSLSLSSTFNLSFSVFTSTTLVVLKLRGFTVNGTSLFSVSFPSLKILHMRLVCFKESRYIHEILSACPILEDLVMKILQFKNGNVGCVASISELYLPKLVKADISRSNLRIPWKSFYNAEFLRASVITMEDLSPHVFSNLTYLELRHVVNYFWECLIELLHNCHHLQTLVIDKRLPINDEKWVHPLSVPECILSKLKRFRINKYEGKKEEVQFTRFIMQNARVLRNVTICSGSSSNPNEKLQMLKDLSSCARASVTCELYFE